MTSLETGKRIILFDGVCNLCNGAVNFVIRHDKEDLYRFATLQSSYATDFMKARGISTKKTDSLVLFIPGEAYYLKSTAALKIGKSFGGIWQLLTVFEWLPTPIRDWIYDIIARNRYRWFGRRDHCMIPTFQLQNKFITSST